MQPHKRKAAIRLWGKPVLLFVLILAGLIVCLLKEGIWDVFAWMALLIPVILIIKYSYWPKPDNNP